MIFGVVLIKVISLILLVFLSSIRTVVSFTATTTCMHLHQTIQIIQTSPIKHHETLLYAKKKQGGGDNDVVTLIHSHHLLEHKPDNMILKGGKFKLRGVGCLGRPGIALCIGPQKSIEKFISKLKSAMPQKKFGMVSLDVSVEELDNMQEFGEATLGQLRGILASIGHEDKFFAVTGIDPLIATPSSSNKGEELENNHYKLSGKKKRKR